MLGVSNNHQQKPLGILKARDNSVSKNTVNTKSNYGANNYYFQPSINASGNKNEIKEAMREAFEEFKDFIDNIREENERININEPEFSI